MRSYQMTPYTSVKPQRLPCAQGEQNSVFLVRDRPKVIFVCMHVSMCVSERERERENLNFEKQFYMLVLQKTYIFYILNHSLRINR